jgi:UrcA family protein
MKTSIKLLLPLVAATITSLASATERIEIRAGVPSVVVKYDLASLATRAGVQDLHSRLAIAAQTVCTELDTKELGLRKQHDQCVRDAIRRSVADVGNDNLTKYYRYRALPRMVAAN